MRFNNEMYEKNKFRRLIMIGFNFISHFILLLYFCKDVHVFATILLPGIHKICSFEFLPILTFLLSCFVLCKTVFRLWSHMLISAAIFSL